MFALSPVATASTALSVPPSVLAVPAPDLVSTRTTAVAVAAPLSNLSVANDARSPAVIPAPAAETENPQPAPQENATAGAAENPAATGPSSTFLAQLLSQSSDQEDNQIALATSFSRFAPAPQYTTFVGYSVVKFRPSDAGLPSAYAPAAGASAADESQNDNTPLVSVASDYRAYNATQSRNQSNLAPQDSHVTVAG